MDDILRVCREHCNSTHFIIIDNANNIPEHFFDSVLLSIDANHDTSDGYRIYKSQT